MKIKQSVSSLWIVGLLVVAGFGLFLLFGTPQTHAAAPADNAPHAIEVKIDNFSFGPMTLSVPSGTTVTWTNNDDVPHTVVSDDHATFKSPALDTGEKFSFTFDKPGKYAYFCSVHPKMTAQVVVQ